MPIPKALQDALDTTDTPAAPGKVFDFESGNKTVKPATPDPDPTTIDTSGDNWLDDLMSDPTPDPDPDPDPTPDPDPVENFTDDSSPDDFLLPDVDGDGDTSQYDELKEIISQLEGKINKSDAEEAQQKLLDDSIAALKEKYGEVDQDILENFADLHATFRASLAQDLGAEMVRTNIQQEARIKQLEDKIEELISAPAKPDTSPIPAENSSPTDYRNLMAEAIPDYQKMVASPQFKQLMKTPVDPDNPEFTYNQKLGRLYGQRRTADIMKFFSSFAEKYNAGGRGNGAVVDSGKSSSSQGGQPGKNVLNPDRLRSILSKVMTGELKLSEADMLKLRQMAAKQAMN